MRTMKPSWSMWAKTMTEGASESPGQRGHQVAQPVGAVLEPHAVEVRGDRRRHAVLIPGQAGHQHQLGQQVARRSVSLRVARTRSMKSVGALGIDRQPGVAVDLERRADDDAVGHGQDVGHGVVLDAGVGQHRRVGQHRLHGFEVAHRGGLAGDGARDQHRVGDRGDHRRAGPIGQAAAVERIRRTRPRRCRASTTSPAPSRRA